MKYLILLGAFLFAPDLFSAEVTLKKLTNIRYSNPSLVIKLSPSPILPIWGDVADPKFPSAEWLTSRYSIQYDYANKIWTCKKDPNSHWSSNRLECTTPTGAVDTLAIYFDFESTKLTGEETATCKIFDGETLAGEFSSDTPRCVDFGHKTGGPAALSKPLLCLTRATIGVGSPPKWTHAVTSTSCTQATSDDPPPDSGGGTGGSTGGGTGGSTGGGTGGSTGGGTGTTTDLKPVTDRLDAIKQDTKDQSKALLDQIAAANNNQVAATNQVNNSVNNVKTSLDGIANSVGQQNYTQQQLLSELQAMRGVMSSGSAETNLKLGHILDELKKQNAGEPADPHQVARDLTMPDPKKTIDDGMADAMAAIDSTVAESGIERLKTESEIKNALSNAETIGEFFDVAAANCSPIPFGRTTISFCDVAPRISAILEFIIWALTLIFVVSFFGHYLSKDQITW